MLPGPDSRVSDGDENGGGCMNRGFKSWNPRHTYREVLFVEPDIKATKRQCIIELSDQRFVLAVMGQKYVGQFHYDCQAFP
ncbi:MAG: hypothetical protein Rhob2KO_53050 [Rhodopirellula baltica]